MQSGCETNKIPVRSFNQTYLPHIRERCRKIIVPLGLHRYFHPWFNHSTTTLAFVWGRPSFLQHMNVSEDVDSEYQNSKKFSQKTNYAQNIGKVLDIWRALGLVWVDYTYGKIDNPWLSADFFKFFHTTGLEWLPRAAVGNLARLCLQEVSSKLKDRSQLSNFFRGFAIV